MTSRATGMVLAGLPNPDPEVVDVVMHDWWFHLRHHIQTDLPEDIQASILAVLPRLAAFEDRVSQLSTYSLQRSNTTWIL